MHIGGNDTGVVSGPKLVDDVIITVGRQVIEVVGLVIVGTVRLVTVAMLSYRHRGQMSILRKLDSCIIDDGVFSCHHQPQNLASQPNTANHMDHLCGTP